MQNLINDKKLAATLGISLSGIRKNRHAKVCERLPFMRIGRLVRYDTQAVFDFLKHQNEDDLIKLRKD